MDIKHNLDYRFENNKKFDTSGTNKYDYQTNGILDKCLPKILFKGNSILVTFLQLIDNRIIMMLKYIDKIKEFKYISKYY